MNYKNIIQLFETENLYLFLINFCIGIVLFFIIDIFYLMGVSKYFTKMTKNIRLRKHYLIIPIIFIYIILFTSLYYFILKDINIDIQFNNTFYKKVFKIILNAFILGFSIYSIYELTNYALFKNWTLHMVLLDSLWGGTLFSIVTFLYLCISKLLKVYFMVL